MAKHTDSSSNSAMGNLLRQSLSATPVYLSEEENNKISARAQGLSHLNAQHKEKLARLKAERSRTGGEFAQDAAASAVKGITGINQGLYGISEALYNNNPIKAVAELAGANPRSLDEIAGLSSSFDSARQDVDANYATDVSVESNRKVEEKTAERAAGKAARVTKLVQEEGYSPDMASVVDEAGSIAETVMDYKDNPVALGNLLIEQIPQLIGAGVTGSASKLLATKGMTESAKEVLKTTARGKAKLENAGTIGAVLYTGGQEGGSNAVQAEADVLKMSHEELVKGSDQYNELIKVMSPTEAKRSLADMVASETFIPAALIGAGISKLSGAGKLEGNVFSPDLIKGSIKNALAAGTKDLAGRTVKEAFEESIQGAAGQISSNVAKKRHVDKDTDVLGGVGANIGAGALAGGLSAGALSGPGTVVATTKESIKAASAEFTAQTQAVKDAIDKAKEGNVAELVNDPDHNINTKMDGILQRNAVEGTTDEEHTANIGEARKLIVESMTESENLIKKMEESNSEKEIKKLQAAHTTLQKQQQLALTQFKAVQTREQSKVTTEKVEASIESGNVQDFVGSFRLSPESISEEDVIAFKKVAKDLPPEVERELDAHIELEQAIKSMDEVSSNIIDGSAKDKFLGIRNYQSSINAAMDLGDKSTANAQLSKLRKFAEGHADKAQTFAKAFAGDTTAIQESAAKWNNTITPKVRNAKFSAGLVARTGSESIALNAAVAQAEARIGIKPEVSTQETTNVQEETTKPEATQAKPKVAEGSSEAVPIQSTETKEKTANLEKEVKELTTEAEKFRKSNKTTSQVIARAGGLNKESFIADGVDIEDIADKNATEFHKLFKVEGGLTTDGLVEILSEDTGASLTESDVVELVNEILSGNDSIHDLYKEAEYQGMLAKIDALEQEISELGFEVSENLSTIEQVPIKPEPINLTETLLTAKSEGGVSLSDIGFIVKAPPQGEKASPAALTVEADLMTRLAEDPSLALKYADTDKQDKDSEGKPVLSDKQSTALKTMIAFRDQTVASFNKLFRHRHQNAKDDFLQYMSVDGVVDENVKTAIAMGAYNWVISSAGKTMFNNFEDINSMLGRKDDAIMGDLPNLLTTAGATENSIIDSIGPAIAASLGLVSADTAPVSNKSNLEQSLGAMGLSMLLDSGYIKQNLIPAPDITAAFPPGDRLIREKEIQDGERAPDVRVENLKSGGTREVILNRPFYRVATVVVDEQEEMDGNPAAIVDSNADTAGIFTELFGIQFGLTGPKSKPKGKVSKFQRKTDMLTPAEAVPIIKKHQERAHYISREKMDKFLALPREVQLKIMGHEDKLVHVSQRKALLAKNNSIERELKYMEKANEEFGDNAMYFEHEMTVVNRLLLVSNTFNPQGSKTHRHFVQQASWTNTVDKDDTQQMNEFFSAFGESMGVKTDKGTWLGTFTHPGYGEKIMSMVNDPSIQAAADAVYSGKGDSEIFLPYIKEGAYSYDGLMNLGRYRDSLGSQLFETDLFREIDGVTNGVIIGTLNLDAGTSEADKTTKLARGGLLSDGVTDQFGIYRELNDDSYTAISSSWNGKFLDLLRNLTGNDRVKARAARQIFGLEIERNDSKGGLIQTVYGAADPSIKESVGYAFLDKFYAHVTKASEKNDRTTLKRLSIAMNTIVPGSIRLDSEPMEQLLSGKHEAELVKFIEATYGESLVEAIDESFGDFKKKGKMINDALDVAFQSYKLMYDKEIAKLQVDDYKITQEDVNNINKEFVAAMPIMKTFFSQKTGEILEGLFVGKYELKRTESSEYTVDQRYLVKPDGAESKNLTTQGRVREMVSPGASPAVLGVQSIDAATMLIHLKKYAALNVYDAIITGQDEALKQAKNINKAFIQVQEEFSIMSSAYDAMKRSLDVLYKYDPALVKAIKLKAEVAKDKDTGEVTYTKRYLDKFSREMQALSTKVDTAKGKRIKNFSTVSQYHIDGGETLRATRLPANIPKAIVKEVMEKGIDYKGSSSEGIDLDTFQTDVVTRVSRMEALQVFESLGSIGSVKDSFAHAEHLRTLMTDVISQVLDPVTLHMENDNQGETRGMTNGVDMYIINQTATPNVTVSGMTTNGTRMSSQEVYSHEMVHNVSRAGVDKSSPMSARIARLWQKAREGITVEAFMNPNVPDTPIERLAAQRKWDHVFDPVSKADGKADYLHEFMAFSMTNARFREALRKLTPNVGADFKLSTNLLEMVAELFAIIMDAWHRLTVVKGNADITAVDQMDNLFRAVSNVNQRHKNPILAQLESVADLTTEKMNGLIIQTRQALVKIADSPIVANSKLLPVRLTGVISATLLENRPDFIFEGLRQIYNESSEGKEGLFGATVTELMGRTIDNGVFHDLNRIANMTVDQQRNHIKTLISELSNKMYEAHKDGLTDVQKVAITKIALKTDLQSLTDGRSLAEIQQLVESDTKLDAEIARLTADVYKFGNLGNFYSRMAENLGHFMVKGTAIETHTLMNARQIAEVWVEGKPTPVWAKEAEPIIDQLATLHAIKYSDKAYRKEFSQVMLTESANNNLKNGVSFTLSMAANIKKDSEKRIFVGHNAMIKGYTKETLNPNIGVEYGQLSDEAEMNRMGFFRDPQAKPLAKDATDPNNTIPIYMFVNRHGGLNRFVSGSISKTGKVAKGANTFTTRSQLGDPTPGITAIHDIVDTKASKKALIEDIFNSPKQLSPNATYTIPVMNNVKKVIGYRYMMSEHVKDTFMEKDNDFASVMGTTAANIEDKVASKDINEKVVVALKEQYDTDFATGYRGFVAIGPNSPDKDLREMYYMLPDETRRFIKNTWSKDTMYVKREHVNLIFGYRKFSVTDVWHDDPSDLNGFQRLYIQSMEQLFSIWGGSAYSGIKSFESSFQEVIKDIKDIIVIKTGVVTLVNTLSNTVSLRMLGVPMLDIVRNQAIAFKGAVDYQKDTKELHTLETILANEQRPNRRTLDKQQVAILKNRIANNPVRELVESGVYQTIVEDIDSTDAQFTYKSKFSEMVGNLTEPVTSRINDNVKTVAKNMYMSHDSKTYKMFNQAAVLSDFTARYALHKHYTTRAENRLSSKDSIAKVVSIFIDYDLPTHKGMQYLNDMGLVWFSKYNFRLQKILMETMSESPARVIMLLALQSSAGDVPNMFDNSVFTHDMSNMLRNPLNNLDVISEIAPIGMATSVF